MKKATILVFVLVFALSSCNKELAGKEKLAVTKMIEGQTALFRLAPDSPVDTYLAFNQIHYNSTRGLTIMAPVDESGNPGYIYPPRSFFS